MKRDKEYYLTKAIALGVAEARGGKVSSPEAVYNALSPWTAADQENFLILPLNGNNCIIDIKAVSLGTVNRAIVHPREVFRPAIALNAVAIIVAHNHPSGNLAPSPEDDEITKRLSKAGEILGIPLLDHLIIGRNGFYSYKESGKIN